jgi:hypothetical protein
MMLATGAGAVVGPNLVGPFGVLAHWLGLDHLAGGFLAAAVLATAAAFLVGGIPAGERPASTQPSSSTPSPLSHVTGVPLSAVAALVVAHGVMVLVMAVTPLHLDHQGHSLGSIGLVVSAHTLGMYSPALLSRRLITWRGARGSASIGLVVVAISGLISTRSTDGPMLALGLFMLGAGWNVAYLATSSLLAGGPEQGRVQGSADGLAWTAGAGASLMSGVTYSAGGYALAAIAASGLALIMVVTLWLAAAGRRSQRTSTAPSGEQGPAHGDSVAALVAVEHERRQRA